MWKSPAATNRAGEGRDRAKGRAGEAVRAADTPDAPANPRIDSSERISGPLQDQHDGLYHLQLVIREAVYFDVRRNRRPDWLALYPQGLDLAMSSAERRNGQRVKVEVERATPRRHPSVAATPKPCASAQIVHLRWGSRPQWTGDDIGAEHLRFAIGRRQILSNRRAAPCRRCSIGSSSLSSCQFLPIWSGIGTNTGTTLHPPALARRAIVKAQVQPASSRRNCTLDPPVHAPFWLTNEDEKVPRTVRPRDACFNPNPVWLANHEGPPVVFRRPSEARCRVRQLLPASQPWCLPDAGQTPPTASRPTPRRL